MHTLESAGKCRGKSMNPSEGNRPCMWCGRLHEGTCPRPPKHWSVTV